MNWSAIAAQVFKLALRLAVAIAVSWGLRQSNFYEFTAREAEGLNTVILLLGNIYAVMYAFVIFVIWSQWTDVENFVMRECNALTDLLRFAEHLNADGSHTIRRAVSDYAQMVLKSEWRALGEHRRDKQTERSFSELMDAVIRTPPADPAEDAIHQRMIGIIRQAAEHRDERITKSLTRIPATLNRLVDTMAGALLLLVFVYPFHHWLVGVSCFTLMAVVLFLANVVMEDTDNPFNGVCNVSSQPLSDLM